MEDKRWTRHGYVGTRTYVAWQRMHQRCGNPRNDRWKWYGGRGIKVCQRWKFFVNFLADMGDAPTRKHSIDRIDSNGNYEKTNCRWSTVSEQMANRRQRSNSVFLTFQGETLSVTDWALKLNIKRFTLYGRVRAGWKTEHVLMIPPHR